MIAARSADRRLLRQSDTRAFNPAVAYGGESAHRPRFNGAPLHLPQRSLDIDVVVRPDDSTTRRRPGRSQVRGEAIRGPSAVPGPDGPSRQRERASSVRDGCIGEPARQRISRYRVSPDSLRPPATYLSIAMRPKIERWHLVKTEGIPPSIQGGDVEVATRSSQSGARAFSSGGRIPSPPPSPARTAAARWRWRMSDYPSDCPDVQSISRSHHVSLRSTRPPARI